jgi:hypothetical protein
MVTSEGDEAVSEMQIWMDGARMKTQILQGGEGNPMMPPGSYMLMGEQGIFLVNPEARTFARFDMSMIQDAVQAVGGVAGPGGAFQISDASVEKTIDEAGPEIEGYATRHYQFKSSWTMQMTGAPMKTTMATIEDVWATDQIAMPAGGELPFDTSTLPADLQVLADAQGRGDVSGFPLRTITEQTTKTDMGIAGFGGGAAQRMMYSAMAGAGAGDTKTTVEAVGIEEIDIAADTFEIPADFSETQLFQNASTP